MFDLDKSIKEWLKTLRKHRAFNHGSIHEIELHIRDHIDDLTSDGCTEQEAFQKAIAEFGEISPMAREEFYNQQPRTTSGLFFATYSNYVKVAVRSFTKQPFFTFLNMVGLAVGMAGALLIGLYVHNELSNNQMFADASRIYRVNIDNQTAGELTKYASVSGPLADVMRQDYPNQELVTRFKNVGSTLLKEPDGELNVKEDKVVAVDSTFLQMFGLQLLMGNPKSAFNQPNSLILTQNAVEKHFQAESALGKSLVLNNNEEYVITGIIQDMPRNSLLRDYEVFISLSSFEEAKSLAWNNWNYPTFVKLKPNTDSEDLQEYLDGVTERYLIPWAMTFVPGLTLESARAHREKTGDYMDFGAVSLTDIHLHSTDREGEFNQNSDIQNIYILSFIGLFILILASVNFMNLSTAHSLKRAKEVGIRKSLGSSRLRLIHQFLTESAVISFISLLIALLIARIALPYYNDLSGKVISIPFDSVEFLLLLIGSTSVLALISGFYPAFLLSRFESAEVLKGVQGRNFGGSTMRSVLVVFQFTVAVFLIVGTLVVYQQLSFIQNKDLGYNKEQLLILENVEAVGSQPQALKEEMKKIGAVLDVSLSSFLPTPSARSGITYFRDGSLDSKDAVIIGNWRIDHDYIQTLGLEIITGRNFSSQFPGDSSAIILNESSLSMFNVTAQEALGMRITDDFHRPDKENMKFYTIIGVVKNFHYESLRNNINGLSFRLGNNADRMIIKLSPGNFADAIANIELLWKRLSPGQPFSYYFMDESFNDTYNEDARLGKIFTVFTILSIFIACLGLFGLAAYNAEKRSKEIGIRKVLGAKVGQITFKLSIDFLKLVSFAILISLPLAWFAMDQWLQDFIYRVEISWWVFAASALLAIAISILTVSYQSFKAAVVNPVRSLKSE